MNSSDVLTLSRDGGIEAHIGVVGGLRRGDVREANRVAFQARRFFHEAGIGARESAWRPGRGIRAGVLRVGAWRREKDFRKMESGD